MLAHILVVRAENVKRMKKWQDEWDVTESLRHHQFGMKIITVFRLYIGTVQEILFRRAFINGGNFIGSIPIIQAQILENFLNKLQYILKRVKLIKCLKTNI
jgi:hypothetical protein